MTVQRERFADLVHRDVTVAEVCAVIGLPVPDPGTADGVWLAAAVAAVSALALDTVPRLRELDTDADYPADVRAALMMQAQRLFARRSSPTGIAGYSDSGGSVYISRWDPDVERMLRIGSWSKPQVG
jgi:hypothetical protein